MYGAPVWASTMAEKRRAVEGGKENGIESGVSIPDSIGRRSADISRYAPAIDLMAMKRKAIFEGSMKEAARQQLFADWQFRWDTSTKGRWTHRLIPNIATWLKRSHGEVNYRLTQLLNGHGCFPSYLNRFGKLGSSACWYCGDINDDDYHSIFVCDAWYSRRVRVNTISGTPISPENMIQ